MLHWNEVNFVKIFLHHKSFGAKKFCNVKYFNYLLGLHYIILIGNNYIYCHNYKQTQIGNCRLMKWLLVLIKIELTVWSEWYYSFFWRNSPGTLPGLGPMTSLNISFLPTPLRPGPTLTWAHFPPNGMSFPILFSCCIHRYSNKREIERLTHISTHTNNKAAYMIALQTFTFILKQ